MDALKEKFYKAAQPVVEEVKNLVKEHGEVKVGEYNIDQVITGQKGIVGLLTLTSKLDPQEGIRFRGYSIPELQAMLPKLNPDDEPLPEGIFHLMLLDELPSEDDVKYLSAGWNRRSAVPQYVFDLIDSQPNTAHPMTLFSMAIMSMSSDSKFLKAYLEGLNKKDYWDTTYEDVMDLIARLPRIAAYIYRKLYYNNQQIDPDPNLDWAGNLAKMMGHDNDEVKRLLRLYMVVHADHEGGNVSAHTAHLVGSALSNAYLSYGAGMAGLAGPLHGMANQEVISWLFQLKQEIGGTCCDEVKIKAYIEKTISEGRVIPGYGHAVLRITDPRYTAQREFAKRYMPEDENFRLVSILYDVVPPILRSLGKVKNPWPNVDAHSGALLYHYGIKEYEFYTVLFGVSRALGVLAQLIWDRAIGLQIERPSSETLEYFRELVKK